jgi:putative hydrolase of the HAD superfamily
MVWAEKHRDLLSHFKEIFVSSHMGCRKPDAAAYLHVSRSIGAPCSEILFFDDAEENVQGARKAGMQSIRVDQADTISQCIRPILAKPWK